MKELLYWNPAYFIRRGIWLADLNEFEDFFADPICDEVMELFNSEPFPLVEIQFVSSNRKLVVDKKDACLKQPAIYRFDLRNDLNRHYWNLRQRRREDGELNAHYESLYAAYARQSPVALSLFGLRFQIRLGLQYNEFRSFVVSTFGRFPDWPKNSEQVKAWTQVRRLSKVQYINDYQQDNGSWPTLPSTISIGPRSLSTGGVTLAFVQVENKAPLIYPAWLVKILNSNE